MLLRGGGRVTLGESGGDVGSGAGADASAPHSIVPPPSDSASLMCAYSAFCDSTDAGGNGRPKLAGGRVGSGRGGTPTFAAALAASVTERAEWTDDDVDDDVDDVVRSSTAAALAISLSSVLAISSTLCESPSDSMIELLNAAAHASTSICESAASSSSETGVRSQIAKGAPCRAGSALLSATCSEATERLTTCSAFFALALSKKSTLCRPCNALCCSDTQNVRHLTRDAMPVNGTNAMRSEPSRTVEPDDTVQQEGA